MTFHYSDTCKASPSTIWETCFTDMKWGSWDVDVKEVIDVSGGCENGTTFTFDMKSGQKAACTLQDVVKNETLTFQGQIMGGLGNFKGVVKLIPDTTAEDKTTTIDYTFSWGGFVGPLLSFALAKPSDEGTKHGLENMIRMSEEAAAKK